MSSIWRVCSRGVYDGGWHVGSKERGRVWRVCGIELVSLDRLRISVDTEGNGL